MRLFVLHFLTNHGRLFWFWHLIDILANRLAYFIEFTSKFSEILEWNCPYKLFKDWMNLAVEKLSEPNAMTLATASKSGIPSARMVLLKDFSKGTTKDRLKNILNVKSERLFLRIRVYVLHKLRRSESSRIGRKSSSGTCFILGWTSSIC